MKINLSLKSWTVLGVVASGFLSYVTGVKLLVLFYSLIASVLFTVALVRDVKGCVKLAKALFIWYLLNLGAIYVVFSVNGYPGSNVMGYSFLGLFAGGLVYFAFTDQKTAVRMFFYMQAFLFAGCLYC